VRLTTLPPSCVDFLEIWEPQPPGIPSGPVQASNGIALPFTFYTCTYNRLPEDELSGSKHVQDSINQYISLEKCEFCWFIWYKKLFGLMVSVRKCLVLFSREAVHEGFAAQQEHSPGSPLICV
jgi:hypothetical protein